MHSTYRCKACERLRLRPARASEETQQSPSHRRATKSTGREGISKHTLVQTNGLLRCSRGDPSDRRLDTIVVRPIPYECLSVASLSLCPREAAIVHWQKLRDHTPDGNNHVRLRYPLFSVDASPGYVSVTTTGLPTPRPGKDQRELGTTRPNEDYPNFKYTMHDCGPYRRRNLSEKHVQTPLRSYTLRRSTRTPTTFGYATGT